MDYLLTWNLRHIANAQMRHLIDRACLDAGFVPPVICTPEELLELPLMPNDPIVEEVRQARAALLEKAGGTLEKLFDYLQSQEAASGRPAVTLQPKRPGELPAPGS